MNGQFWMVFGIGQHEPKCQHPTLHDARTEAKRLAKLNPETVFVVLEAVEAIVKREFSTYNFRSATSFDDDIPF